MTLDEALISVWRQSLIEDANIVELEDRRIPVRRTARQRLRQVEFEFQGEHFRGIEQNPDTRSRWAALARSGQKVMQFVSAGRYLANVADGSVTFYRSPVSAGKKSARSS
ncbi:MAG: hypothetical protein ACLP1Y_02680 [Candidatus Acidiferrales bacterium]